MLKLLIADDEYIVNESIKFIIDKYVDFVEVVGCAKSGREAIEMALDLKPDVIFMDIRMPGINGIDAIRQIRDVDKDTKFVIITAYEYFEYAKEAVNLDVFEYLLKPLNKQKVIKVLNDLNRVISMKKKAIQRELILKEKINKILPILEGQFINSQLFNSGIINDLQFYEEIFNTKLKNGYVIMGLIEDFSSSLKEENLKNSLKKQKFFNVFSLELKSITNCLVGQPLLDRIVAYIPCDTDKNSYKIRNDSIEIATKIIDKIRKNVDVNCKIGLGRNYSIENFLKSYNEAYMATSVPSKDTIIHFEDIVLSINKQESYPLKNEKRLIQNIMVGDINGAIEVFEEIFLWITINYKEDIDKIKSSLLELLIVLQRSIPFEIRKKDFSDKTLVINILKNNDIRNIKINYINHLKNIIQSVKQSRKQELDGLISKAIKYIENNYDKNISLDDVAKEINMSYHYFSKFFKDSIGKNFVDYLTELRIEKSKEMLRSSSMSIKEISYKVGYSDPNYFSKIFKKATGMRPTDYRINFVS
ncbi:response regulator transcription factor [Thermohalobacter berrensis]|uniref:DNA-binding response regulator n=1 Tax=Thermohalobacter berrensis TaxID=99594 RepID=A0A419T6Y3_9FIRM|nr:response regulator [Thermohalobacter berrensis]RKD33179.1 DNA-binding response regulator [Thermohalobacter berrensis]